MPKRAVKLLFCAALFLCGAGSVHAQAFTVAPKIIDLLVQPRDVVEQKILIKTGGNQLTVYPFVNNVSIGMDGGVEEFVPPSMSDKTSSLSSWLEISRTGMDLAASSEREIPLTIRVNPTAAPGTYHAMISYARGGNATEAENAFKAGNAESVMLNVTIDDKRSELLSLSRFIVKRFVTTVDNADIQYQVVNPGDGEISPRGDIILYNQRGEEVGLVPINPDKTTVAPGETKHFTARVPIEGLLGKYKAFMSMQYGEGQAAVYDTVYFYVLPWKKLLIIFAIFLICAVLASLFIHRRYFHRHMDDDDADDLPLEIKPTFSGGKDSDIVMKH